MMEALPLNPEPPVGSHKKVIYLVRHAEAEHNVLERQAVQAAIASGETKDKQEEARRNVLNTNPNLRDAPLSKDGTEQARTSGLKLGTLFSRFTNTTTTNTTTTSQQQVNNSISSSQEQQEEYMTPTGSPLRSNPPSSTSKQQQQQQSPFRPPDVVLVSPLRRALMTATELFLHSRHPDDTSDPPLFLAIEALREKRTGMACDERSAINAELQNAFPHVDFSDVLRGIPHVPEGETNEQVRARAAAFVDDRLASIPGKYLAIVSHKGWLREHRKVLKSRVQAGLIRADFDINEWDTKLYGNAEVRVAAFRWQDGELISVFDRSVDNAKLVSATMMGDGFEFTLGPPSSGFSMFLADRTTKVHFISLAEGRHNVAVNEAVEEGYHSETVLMREEGKLASEHPLYDARLTRKGLRQAQKLKDMLAHRPSGGRPFTAFELVISSPLTRALETTREIFSKTPGTYGGVVVPPPRVEVVEDCRERYGRYVCDGRRSVSELQSEFPTFDFSKMMMQDDNNTNTNTVLHTEERETALEVQERAIRLLQSLSARPERCIAVVTHTEFLRHLFGQFGDTLDDDDRTALQRTAKNCELRSVVLCSHRSDVHEQRRERDPKQSSTIRVPSSTSMSSLTAFEDEPVNLNYGRSEEDAVATTTTSLSMDQESEVPLSF